MLSEACFVKEAKGKFTAAHALWTSLELGEEEWVALDLVCLRQDYVHSYCFITEETSYPLAPSPQHTHLNTDADSWRESTSALIGGISVVPGILLHLLKALC